MKSAPNWGVDRLPEVWQKKIAVHFGELGMARTNDVL